MKSPKRFELWKKAHLFDPSDPTYESGAESGMTLLESFAEMGKSMDEFNKANEAYEKSLKDLNDFMKENKDVVEKVAEKAIEAEQKASEAEGLYNKGLGLAGNQDVAGAIKAFEESVAIYPAAEAYHGRIAPSAMSFWQALKQPSMPSSLK